MKIKLNYKQPTTWDANELKVGDLMEVFHSSFFGEIILKTQSCFVSLTNPNCTWPLGTKGLIGTKLQPGESITLIQE